MEAAAVAVVADLAAALADRLGRRRRTRRHVGGGANTNAKKYSLNFNVQALNLFNDIDLGKPVGGIEPTPIDSGNGLTLRTGRAVRQIERSGRRNLLDKLGCAAHVCAGGVPVLKAGTERPREQGTKKLGLAISL